MAELPTLAGESVFTEEALAPKPASSGLAAGPLPTWTPPEQDLDAQDFSFFDDPPTTPTEQSNMEAAAAVEAMNAAADKTDQEYLEALQLLSLRRPGKAIDNPKREILDEQLAMFAGQMGGGLPTFEDTLAQAGLSLDFDMPTRIEGESAEAYDERVALAQGAWAADIDEARDEYDTMMQQVLTDPGMIAEAGGPNIMQAAVSGLTQRTEAEQYQLETAASRLEQTAATVSESVAAIQANEQARQERVALEVEANHQVQKTLQAARRRYEAMDTPDSQRYFKSMTGSQKFLAIVGSIMTGWNGSQMVPQMLLQLASQDLEAQKAGLAKGQAEVRHAAVEHDAQMNVYQSILNQVKDERSADLIKLSLDMQDAEAMFAAEMARTTIEVHKAQMYEAMVGLKAQQANLLAELKLRAAAVPEKIVVGGGPVLRGKAAELVLHRGKKAVESGARVREGAAEMPWEAAKAEGNVRGKILVEEAKAALKGQAEGDTNAQNVDAALDLYQRMVERYGTSDGGFDFPQSAGSYRNPFSADASEAQSMVDTFSRAFAKTVERDRLSNEDAQKYDDIVQGDWTVIRDDQKSAKMKQAAEFLRMYSKKYRNADQALVGSSFKMIQ